MKEEQMAKLSKTKVIMFLLVLAVLPCNAISAAGNSESDMVNDSISESRLVNLRSKENFSHYFEEVARKSLRDGNFIEAYKILSSVKKYDLTADVGSLLAEFAAGGSYFDQIEEDLKDSDLFRYKAWNGKWGFIEKSGEVVIDPIYESAHDFSEGYARISVDNKWHFIDRQGKIVLSEKLTDDIRISFLGSMHDGLIRAYISSYSRGWENNGFINISGEVIISPSTEIFYDDDFSEGVAKFRSSNDEFGYIDPVGKIVIPAEYNDAKDFHNGYAFVQYERGRGWGFIDKAGREHKPVFDGDLFFGDFNNGLAIGYVSSLEEFAAIDTSGNVKFNLTDVVSNFMGFQCTHRHLRLFSSYSEGLSIWAIDRNAGSQSVHILIVDTNGEVIMHYKPKLAGSEPYLVMDFERVFGLGLYSEGAALIAFDSGLGMFNCYGEIIEKPITWQVNGASDIDFSGARGSLWPVLDGADVISYINNEGKTVNPQ